MILGGSTGARRITTFGAELSPRSTTHPHMRWITASGQVHPVERRRRSHRAMIPPGHRIGWNGGSHSHSRIGVRIQPASSARGGPMAGGTFHPIRSRSCREDCGPAGTRRPDSAYGLQFDLATCNQRDDGRRLKTMCSSSPNRPPLSRTNGWGGLQAAFRSREIRMRRNTDQARLPVQCRRRADTAAARILPGDDPSRRLHRPPVAPTIQSTSEAATASSSSATSRVPAHSSICRADVSGTSMPCARRCIASAARRTATGRRRSRWPTAAGAPGAVLAGDGLMPRSRRRSWWDRHHAAALRCPRPGVDGSSLSE